MLLDLVPVPKTERKRPMVQLIASENLYLARYARLSVGCTTLSDSLLRFLRLGDSLLCLQVDDSTLRWFCLHAVDYVEYNYQLYLMPPLPQLSSILCCRH